ncbi:MAG: hypothetical protein H0X24_03680 [Ktedonobacterales bacterium]|nr:hypothetical protein [Ktedonobacterales bacterium]
MPDDLRAALRARQLPDDEVGLRLLLEAHVAGYDLHRLTPAAAKRWKTRYRLMIGAGYYDGASPAEVYARALLAVSPPTAPSD